MESLNIDMATVEEGVALVDDSDTASIGALTSYVDDVAGKLSGSVGTGATGTLNSTIGLDDSELYSKYGKKLTESNTASAITDAMGLNSLNGVSKVIKDGFIKDINETFNSVTGGWFGDLVSTDGKMTISTLKNFRDEAGSKFMDMVYDYTGFEPLIDRYITNAFANELLKKACDYGIKEFIGPLMESFIFPEDAEEALINSAGRSISSYDIYTLEYILKSLNDDARKRMASTYPYTVPKILAGFHFGREDKPSDYPEIKKTLLYVLTELGGENWMYNNSMLDTYESVEEGGDGGEPTEQEVLSFDLGINMISDDCVTLLMEEPNVYPLIQCSKMFSDENAISVLEKSFPDAPLLDY